MNPVTLLWHHNINAKPINKYNFFSFFFWEKKKRKEKKTLTNCNEYIFYAYFKN